MLENPNLGNVETETTQKLGSFSSENTLVHFKPPALEGHPHLQINEPDYSHVHDGYQYEEIVLNRKFRGPEKFDLGNGLFMELLPQPSAEKSKAPEGDAGKER
jgi:hypothetical protein